MVSGIKASINYLVVQCKNLGLTEAARYLEKAGQALDSPDTAPDGPCNQPSQKRDRQQD